jgi:UDP-N-acetylmuramoyl-L-alanyl-D-glutamate--2,6-diaminopimelate ligase
MLNFLRKTIPERAALRLFYHKIMAIVATIFYRFPSSNLHIIAVTGTSGKSTTVELIQFLLQNTGRKCGSISTINFHIGEETTLNKTLRTSLSPWKTQKMLRKMVSKKCEFCVIEVSSHAIDQNRTWGINIDTAVLTNISDNEHLDYHGTFAEYVRTKAEIFRKLNFLARKPHIQKTIVLNRDDDQYDFFMDFSADKKWTFSSKKRSDFHPENVKFFIEKTVFDLAIPNEKENFSVPIVGAHNLENLITAIAAVSPNGITLKSIKKALEKFKGIPGRLESINLGQKFSVIVDFSYKPSALRAILKTCKDLSKGKIIIVWGGAGGRAESNWRESAKIIHEMADEVVITTDDPGDTDTREISKIIRSEIPRKEGEDFFEIEDRYEAIRYAIFTAQEKDIVIIAGRGHEQTQVVGKQRINFDDREVCREILNDLHRDKK